MLQLINKLLSKTLQNQNYYINYSSISLSTWWRRWRSWEISLIIVLAYDILLNLRTCLIVIKIHTTLLTLINVVFVGLLLLLLLKTKLLIHVILLLKVLNILNLI